MVTEINFPWSTAALFLAIWLLSLCGLSRFFPIFVKQISWKSVRSTLADTSGAGYTIEYLLTLPVYLLFIALFFETTLVLVVMGGTMRAAYSGCRTAVVWDSENSPILVNQLVNDVAVQAFVPFASGLTEIRVHGAPSNPSENERRYVEAYRGYAKAVGRTQTLDRYALAKYRYAAREVRVSVQRQPGQSGQPWDREISVTVSYEYPFGTLGIGRAVGKPGRQGFFVFPVSSAVTMKSELPRNQETKLGIQYARIF